MTKSDKLRIKVAQLCGWTEVSFIEVDATTGYEPTKRVCLGVFDQTSRSTYKDYVPDYPNDLNAMHNAFEILSEAQKSKYAMHLENIIRVIWKLNPEKDVNWFWCSIIHATAEQRAEAFVKTFDKKD